jgi:hypothetical protein
MTNTQITLLALLAAMNSACSPISKLHQVVPTADTTGHSTAIVLIDASPTPAWIYIENRFIGTTPLEYSVAYDSRRRSMEVVAEPLPDNTAQIRQRQRFSLPPLPTRVHFFMNNPNRLSNHD